MRPVPHGAVAVVVDGPERSIAAPDDWTAAQRLEALVMSSDDAIIGNQLDGTIVSWNPGAERLYGYGADEVIGWPITLLAPPASADELAGLMARIARGERVEHCESMRLHKDGCLLEVSITIWPILGTDGSVNGASTIARDISERKRALENDRFRALLEAAPDAMVIVDDTGAILLTNAETERMFGYTRAAIVGEPVKMLIPERYHGHHPGNRERFFGSPRRWAMGAGLSLWGLHQDGTEFPVEISLSPLETEDGLLGTAAIRDITARKQSERELSEANIALESANRAKDRFLASMSHELRTPLNAILGFTGTMLMKLPGPLNADQEHQLLVVRTNGRHLLSLINDLLDLARIESGEIPLTLETIGSERLLGEVVASLQPLADAKHLELSLTVPEAWPEVQSDRRGLRQILINLANNAIKFTDAGRVCLAVGRDRERAVTVFSVADTGRGIIASDQARLFAAFQQVGDADRGEDEGTGLGLYICKSLATALGASISFESEFGSGSTFSLELPD
jgi:PAS domain S-box-containing protein